MTIWLHHVAMAMPRNGTNSHTVDPASSANVVSGAAFTPTAGNLLLLIMGGPVTDTTPDEGWTAPDNGSAIGGSGLYSWTRIATGDDVFITTHNGSNYPVGVEIFEFPAGFTFLGAAAASGVSSGTPGPVLTGLTGTHTDIGVASQSGGFGGFGAWTPGTTLTNYNQPNGDTDGYTIASAYVDGATGDASTQFTTYSGAGFGYEQLVISVQEASTTEPVVIAAPALALTMAARAPVVSTGTAVVIAVPSAHLVLKISAPAVTAAVAVTTAHVMHLALRLIAPSVLTSSTSFDVVFGGVEHEATWSVVQSGIELPVRWYVIESGVEIPLKGAS